MELSDVWRQARAKSAANSPRRAAVREAFEATQALPGVKTWPVEDIRAALAAQLEARGIELQSESQMDLMLQALQTSRKQLVLDLSVKGARKAWHGIQVLKEHAIPTWLNSPDNAEYVRLSDDSVHLTTRVVLAPSDPRLPARIFAEVPPPWGDEDARLFQLWLSAAAGPGGAVLVHAGTETLGRLEPDVADRVRPQLRRLARESRPQRVSAELRGHSVENMTIDVHLAVPDGEPR